MKKRRLLLLAIDSMVYLAVCGVLLLVMFGEDFATKTNWLIKLMHVGLGYGFLVASRFIFKAYNRMWRYAGFNDYFRLLFADLVAGASYSILNLLLRFWQNKTGFFAWNPFLGFIQVFAIYGATCLCSLAARFLYQHYNEIDKEKVDTNKISVAIVGAGSVGVLLAKELISNKYSKYYPAYFIDVDTSKIGNTILDIPVIGENENIVSKIKELPIQEIVIALPKLSAQKKTEKYELYQKTGLSVKTYDYPLNADFGDKRTLRDIKIEDLLFRDSIDFSDSKSFDFYCGKTVLITGGGGSIGSELCRQIAKLSPRKLIILDIYGNNAYDIQQALLRTYGARLNLSVEIASVRDEVKLAEIFEKYKPHVVLHAAAHKHVPLMEDCPSEAIKNNVFGTLKVANLAEKFGVERFILISTDKAVNPTNVMGASKRMCEMIIQSKKDSKTDFVAVRFGNVLGSNGSVIPLFKKQIEHGGPVTITDKRIIRYFMTIPEAAHLVLEAGSMAAKSEIYVLDMGKPVKILDLAENMIRLSGYTPYVDIDIDVIGLRPGEKLYEELLIKTEELDKTDNSLIFIERDVCPSRKELDEKIDLLAKAVETRDNDVIRSTLMQVVPTFKDPATVNRNAEIAHEMQIANK